MKSFIVLALFVAAAVAAPVSPDGAAEIIEQVIDNGGLGNYQYSVKTSNGISQAESGQLKNVGTEAEALEVRGEYSFTDNGVLYVVKYVANELGFQPEGAHLPKAL